MVKGKTVRPTVRRFKDTVVVGEKETREWTRVTWCASGLHVREVYLNVESCVAKLRDGTDT